MTHYRLIHTDRGLGVLLDSQTQPLVIDFLQDYQSRIQSQREALKKLLPKTTAPLSIADVTAGFGEDAYIFASMGHHLHLFEQQPAIAALLKDALTRGHAEKDPTSLKMQLTCGNAFYHLKNILPPDIIYMDPMFPPSKKSRAVSKRMQILQQLADYDELQNNNLFELSMKTATQRVITKCPYYQKPFSPKLRNFYVETSTVRWDVYLTHQEIK